MPTLLLAVKAALYLVMAISVIAAIGVVTLSNLFHAAIALVVVLLGIAGIFLGLHADFLAIVQILIYVGAVMTLVIFAIMLTERFGDKSISQKNQLGLPAFAGAIIFMVALCGILRRVPWVIREETVAAKVSTLDIGTAFLGNYVFPFEVISVVLIVALIGAIVIAKRDKS